MSAHHDEIEERKALFPHRFKSPQIHSSVLQAPGSHIFGDVTIGVDSSIWFNAVLRGDVNYIRIGERTNIQDLSMVHVTHEGAACIVGNDVTVGHSAILHACHVGNSVLIGMGSVVLDGAEIGDHVILGAGSLVTQGTKIPSGSKAFGRPAKVVAQLTPEELAYIKISAQRYVQLAKTYRR